MSDHVSTVVEQWRERRPDLDTAGMALFGRVARLARLADLARARVYADHGLQPGDVDVLSPLWRHGGGLRPRELRRVMMIGSGTLTARLDRLERTGLLERSPDPEDRRGCLLHLTAAGAELVPRIVPELLEVENGLLAELPAGVRSRLSADLGRLLTTLGDDAGGST
jgi:DNA-binding MarR family transcriptional regulator